MPNSLGNAGGISTDTSARRIDRNLSDLAHLNFAGPPTATDAVWANLIERSPMSDTMGNQLFRQIADTWLGPVEDDPLDDTDRYVSMEEAESVLDEAYLDRSGGA